MSAIRFSKLTSSPATANKKYRTWDLRRTEEYRNFGTTYLDYNVIRDVPLNLTTHFDTPQQNVDLTKSSLTAILKEIVADVVSRGFDDRNVTHIFMHLQGMDQEFAFMDSGDKAKSLMHFHLDHSTIEALVDKFSAIIQSGKPVILDGRTRIRVAVFEPPKENPAHDIRRFMGAGGWGHADGFESFSIDEFAQRCRGIVRIQNQDSTCMARALVVGMACLNSEKDQNSLSFYKNIRNPKRKEQYKKALELCAMAEVDPSRPADVTDMDKFANIMEVNIEVFELRNTFLDHVYSTHTVKDRQDLFLLYNAEKKHFDCITNINAVLRAVRNNRRIFCKDCRRVVTLTNDNYHNCYKLNEKKHFVVNKEIVYYEPDYDLMDASTDLSDDGFIKVNERKLDPIPNTKVWYFDFETTVVGKHRDTRELEELPYEWTPYDPSVQEYSPYLYIPRELRRDYVYTQEVNYVILQNAAEDSDPIQFRTLEDFCRFLTHKDMKGSYLIAHYGNGFDFQLLYDYMFRYSGMLHGKIQDPVMRGQKIIKGYLFNDITLIDSYNYVSQALEKMPKIFGFEEMKKGFFPHQFNLPAFQDYVGPMPDKEWYHYREFKPEKQEQFLKWYDQQIANKALFDFRKEMDEYCRSDVDILRRGMQELRRLFMELKDTHTDKTLGADPLHYMTIASLAYDGVYRRHYLKDKTIKYVGRPKRGNYSLVSIEWMEHLMATRNIFIQHSENNEEYEAQLFKPSGETYLKKVDGYDRNTNTIYEFLGCFFHSCKKCYQSDHIHPLKSDLYNKEKRVTHGHVYASTMRVLEDIQNAGYNLEVVWECEWKKTKSKQKLGSNVELCKRLPLNPRDAYYGGRTNATSLYKKCVGEEKIRYIDVVSMYPTVMSLPQYFYPIGQHEVRRFDDPNMPLLPLDQLFGFQKCHVIPPNDLYHPVLPHRSDSGKLLFPLYPIMGTWCHEELQKAVSLGYVVDEVYEQHHFPESNRSNTLFQDYINTFFKMKNEAAANDNKGLKEVAKLCLNSFYGKFGFNIENQSSTQIIRSHKQLWSIVNGSYTKATVDVINNGVAIGNFHINDEYSIHQKSNVYIAAYVTAYARLKLYEALEILQEKVLYFDTDSCVYCSPMGEHLVEISETGDLGTWSDELKDSPGDFFTEFVSSGPKTYAMKSHSGKKDVCKSKGFVLSVKNREIFNFDNLKVQILHKAYNGEFTTKEEEEEDSDVDSDIEDIMGMMLPDYEPVKKKQKLMNLHCDETMMVRKKFELHVQENPGKILNMGYDKRHILTPTVPLSEVTHISTLPFGHKDIV